MTIPSQMDARVCPDGLLQEDASVEIKVHPTIYRTLGVIAADTGKSVSAIANEFIYNALPWSGIPFDHNSPN